MILQTSGGENLLLLFFWLIIASIASTIVASKGHGRLTQVWFFIIGLICWPLAIIASIIRPNIKAQKEAAKRELGDKVLMHKISQLEKKLDSNSTRELETPEGMLVCDNCGEKRPLAMEDCWNCGSTDSTTRSAATEGRELLDSVSYDNQQLSPGKKEVADKPVVQKPEKATQGAKRVACKSCDKKFTGTPGKLASVRSCPKCGATPFDYRFLKST